MVLPDLKKPRILLLLGSVLLLAGLLFFVLRQGRTVVTWKETKQLPYIPTPEIRKTSALATGYTIILQEGRRGSKKTVFLYARSGLGRLTVKILSETIIKKGMPARHLVGRSPYPNPATAPKTTRVLKSLLLKATAYTPGMEDNSGEFSGITAMGWPTGYGIVAVDPSVIPLRSLVYVEGYGTAWAGDTGGAIKGNRIDLCFATKEKADAYGVRNVRVYVLARRNGSAPLMASANLYPRQYIKNESLRFQGIKPYAKPKAKKTKKK